MKKALLLLLVLFALAGCASPTGLKYMEIKHKLETPSSDMARAIFYRPTEFNAYKFGAISINIDGATVGSCLFEGILYKDIPEGEHTLQVLNCPLKTKMEKGNVYYFSIYPRKAYYDAMQKAQVFAIFGGIGAGIAASVAENNESEGETCRGRFAIVPVEKSKALADMAELRLNE
jgi:hypothetical protein